MYFIEKDCHKGQNATTAECLRLLKKAKSKSSIHESLSDEETKEAFETGIRQLAEDIVKYNPQLAQLLLAVGKSTPSQVQPFVPSQN